MELEEAKKLLEEEATKKKEACVKEVNEVLEKHGFVIQVSPVSVVLTPKA